MLQAPIFNCLSFDPFTLLDYGLRPAEVDIGQPRFDHNFHSPDYQAQEFDLALGTPNLHTVRSKVERVECKSVLPSHVFERFSNNALWTDPDININNVRVLLP